MPSYEVILSVKMKAASAEAARQQGDKLAKGLSEKLGPTELQCVWKIRDEEIKRG